jgi:osmotically-inducible protein OsmY
MEARANIKVVTDSIEVAPQILAAEVKDKIEAALKRIVELDARRIRVETTDSKVTLSGNVHSWFERDEAEGAAWAAHGVTQVSNQIAVVP